MNGYQPGQQSYPPPGHMGSMKRNSGYGYQWDRDIEYNDRYPNGPLPQGVESEPYEERRTCCKRCVGHPKGVAIVLILIGCLAILAQIVNTALGAFMSYGVGGVWTGGVYVATGIIGISFENKKSRIKLLAYSILSHLGILLSVILMGICMGGVKQDWKLTDGCGGYSWRRWFDSECVVPQAKIGLHFTLASCGLAGIILSFYTSIGCWYYLGWCGKDMGIKKESTRVPYVWTGSLTRNGTLPRQNSAPPVKPIYTGAQSAKRPRYSTSSRKSTERLDAPSQEQPLTPSDFTPRQIPPQHFILPYPNKEQYPDDDEDEDDQVFSGEPYTPNLQPYIHHSTPAGRAPPIESDL